MQVSKGLYPFYSILMAQSKDNRVVAWSEYTACEVRDARDATILLKEASDPAYSSDCAHVAPSGWQTVCLCSVDRNTVLV